MQDPILLTHTKAGEEIKLSEMTRLKTGLVNNIQPPKPQPPRNKRVTPKKGGSKASKILKGQR